MIEMYKVLKKSANVCAFVIVSMQDNPGLKTSSGK